MDIQPQPLPKHANRTSLSDSDEDISEKPVLDDEKPRFKQDVYLTQTPPASEEEFAPLTDEQKKAQRRFLLKLDACLMTWAFCAYLMKMIDTSNYKTAYVSGMKEDMGFEGNELNWMDSWFRIGYAIFLIPSQLILTRIRANWYLPAAELLWGLCTGLMAIAKNANTMYGLRFAIGLLEASSFPGITCVLCNWYTPREIAMRITIFSASYPVAQIFTGFMQAALHKNMQGINGLQGWQWLFIFNSIMTVVVALFGFFMIPDNPGTAHVRWLSEEEQTMAKNRMDRCHKMPPMGLSWDLLKRVFGNVNTYMFAFAYCSWTMSQHSNTWIGLFLKSVLNDDGTKRFTVSQLNLIPIGGYILQIIAMIGFAFWSDRTGRRASLVAIQEVTVFIGALTLSIWPASFGVKMWGFFMLWLSCAGGPILTAWLADIVMSQEERALIIGATITLNFAIDSWAIRLTYPAKEAPHYRVGYKVPCVLSAVCIAMCGVWYLLDRGRQRRSMKMFTSN